MSQSKQSDTPSNPVDLNTSTEPAATAANPTHNDDEELSEDQLAGVAGGRPKKSPKVSTDSDLRLKHDIEPLMVVGDIALYRFKYIDDDSQTDWVGVMAQDLLDTEHQSAVSTAASGYYQVDYGALGLEMVRYDEWLKQTRH